MFRARQIASHKSQLPSRVVLCGCCRVQTSQTGKHSKNEDRQSPPLRSRSNVGIRLAENLNCRGLDSKQFTRKKEKATPHGSDEMMTDRWNSRDPRKVFASCCCCSPSQEAQVGIFRQAEKRMGAAVVKSDQAMRKGHRNMSAGLDPQVFCHRSVILAVCERCVCFPLHRMAG